MFYNFNKISFIEITIKNRKKERRKEIMAKLFKNWVKFVIKICGFSIFIPRLHLTEFKAENNALFD